MNMQSGFGWNRAGCSRSWLWIWCLEFTGAQHFLTSWLPIFQLHHEACFLFLWRCFLLLTSSSGPLKCSTHILCTLWRNSFSFCTNLSFQIKSKEYSMEQNNNYYQLTLESRMVTICTSCYDHQPLCILYLWVLHGSAIISLNGINQLIIVTVKRGVLFEVRTEFLNNI
jgi:hypothetical protein